MASIWQPLAYSASVSIDWATVTRQYLFVCPVVRVCHVSLSYSLLSGDCGHLHEAVGAAYISGSSLRLSLSTS